MNRSSLFITLMSPILLCAALPGFADGRNRIGPIRRSTAIVVDERLSALRAAPALSAELFHRVARGRMLVVRAERNGVDGIVFYKVNVTRRTSGWIQREAVIRPRQPGEDRRLFRLIGASKDFDLIIRARIFLQVFPHSPLRPQVLLLYAAAAEGASEKLSRDVSRRLDRAEMEAGGAPEFSYFLNYTGLDRYNRQGVRFAFDVKSKEFRYDGKAYREIMRRYPGSPEAVEARKRLVAPSF
ncbi:MAG TPA: hypothetical protein VJ124_15425 [Pyrinomonadaceae bacterium]|nr:hypothetical protein [Pyrinomonadaceae bacterium]